MYSIIEHIIRLDSDKRHKTQLSWDIYEIARI